MVEALPDHDVAVCVVRVHLRKDRSRYGASKLGILINFGTTLSSESPNPQKVDHDAYVSPPYDVAQIHSCRLPKYEQDKSMLFWFVTYHDRAVVTRSF